MTKFEKFWTITDWSSVGSLLAFSEIVSGIGEASAELLAELSAETLLDSGWGSGVICSATGACWKGKYFVKSTHNNFWGVV